MQQKLLLVEDDAGLREQLKWALMDRYRVFEADSLSSTIQIYKMEKPALVCLDMGLESRPERGLDVIDALIGLDPLIKIIVLTASESQMLGRKAIAKGACDYLTKPIDMSELDVLLSRAVRICRLESPTNSGKRKRENDASAPVILGMSKSMEKIVCHITQMAETDM